MRLLIFIVLGLLLVLLGCTELSRDEMNLCYSLSSKSFDYIPNCETESSCYIKVDAAFKTNFDVTSENELYHLKNYNARSWFYYNKAVKEIETISKQCLTKDPSSLPGHINQTQFYINEAFSELDNTIKKSFEIILNEYKFLENEDVDLIKEEKIYDSYIAFKQILTELESGSTKSNSYVSFYTKKIENFKAATPNVPKNLLEKESFQIKFLNFSIDNLLDEAKISNQDSKFYFLAEPIKNILSYFENLIYTTESIYSLKNLPTSKLMLLYSDLLGEKHSAIEQFYNLIKEYNTNFKELNKNKTQLWESLEINYQKSKKLYETSKTNETVEYIRSNLVSEKISSQTDIKKEFFEAETEFINLRKTKFENKLTLGKEISQLKLLNNSFLQLNRQFEELQFQNNTIILEACNKKANEILKLKNELIELQKVYDDLTFYAKQTLKNTEIKFEFCKKAIEKEKEYNIGKNDFELLKSKQIDLTKDCFSYLDNIFKQTNLKELESLYLTLKKETVTPENLFYFKEACEKIKSQVVIEIYSNPQIIDLEKNYLNLVNIKRELILVEQYGSKSQKTKINEVEKEINSLEIYRKNNFFELEKIINICDELNKNLIEFNNELYLYLENEKINIIIGNVKYTNLENGLIVAGKEYDSTLVIELNNPFEKIEKEISFKIPFSIELKHPLVKYSLLGDSESVLVLNGLPFGKTVFNSTYKNKLNFKLTKKVILATNKESIIQNKIELLNEETFFKIAFDISVQKSNKITILKDNEEVSYIYENGVLHFILEDVSKNSNILIQLYIPDLIILEQELKSVENINSTIQTVEYILTLKNTTSEKLTGNILLDFKNNFLIKKINIYDDHYINKQLTNIGDQILLKNIEFFEKEEKKFTLIAQINNSKEYYTQQLIDLAEKLKENSPLLVTQINTHLTYQFSEEWIKTAIKLIKEANLKLDKINQQKAQEEQILLLQNELSDKVEEYETILIDLQNLGLIEESNNLNNIVENAKEILSSNKETDFLKVLTNLNDLNFSISNSIKKELMEILRFLENENFDESLTDKKDQLLSSINLFNYENDIFYLKSNYLKIKENYELFLKAIENNYNLNLKKIKDIKYKITESNLLIAQLKKELSTPQEKLIEIRFIPPITLSRLNKLELQLNSFKETELEKNEIEIFNIYNELLMSYTDIKRQAIDKFNEGVEKNISSTSLTNAKKEIDNNNYILSMFALVENSEQPNQIIGLAPIILIIIIAIVITIYTKKNNKKLKEKKNEIDSSWND